MSKSSKARLSRLRSLTGEPGVAQTPRKRTGGIVRSALDSASSQSFRGEALGDWVAEGPDCTWAQPSSRGGGRRLLGVF